MPPPKKIEIKPTDVPTFYNKLKKESEKTLKKRLKLPQRQALPVNLQKLLDAQLTKTLTSNVESMASSDVEKVMQSELKVTQAAALQNFDVKVKSALGSATHIRKNTDVANILKEKSNLMFSKKQAYVTAGFTDQEAMDIIIAEISGK